MLIEVSKICLRKKYETQNHEDRLKWDFTSHNCFIFFLKWRFDGGDIFP